MILVQVLFDKGERLESPKVLFGEIKKYRDKLKPSHKSYLMLRDEEGKSLLPPLYNYDDIFMKDGGLTVVFRGTERIKTEHGSDEFMQEWEVNYCSDTRITTDILKHTAGADRIHRVDDETNETI